MNLSQLTLRRRGTTSTKPRRLLAIGLGILLIWHGSDRCEAADQTVDERIANTFESDVRPILEQFCFECHAQDPTEADIDLAAFATAADVKQNVKVWLKVRGMLETDQMPPKDSPQPAAEQSTTLKAWVNRFLKRQAEATAGDPGPVVLRRLNNEEYNYTVRDLTGVASLNPTREFPVDGAAGEGFINTGSAQSMSPSFVTKYLDAAKEVASHAVLTPDGIAFSEFTSRRDWTDERVAKIRRFYDRYTVSKDVYVEVGGTGRIANRGGAIPLTRYLAATLEEREALLVGTTTVEAVAKKRGLSNKYLATLWGTLVADPNQQSPLLDQLRDQWRKATPADVDKLVGAIGQLQETVFRYNLIGHIGSDGKPVPWMVPADPIASRRDFSVKLPEKEGDVSVFLIASDADDGNRDDYVIWQNARLTIENGPDIPLRDLAGLERRLRDAQREALAGTTSYLAAAAALQTSESAVADIATKHGLDASILEAWANYLGVGPDEPVIVSGHFENTETHGDYNFIRSWGTGQTPIVTANSSDTQVRIPGIARPRGITAHPSPTLFAAIGWQSPIDGLVKIEARISDAHPECGDGQEWFLQHRTSRKIENLWKDRFGVGGSAEMEPRLVTVRRGELIAFILGPGSGNHACDLTEMNLAITEVKGQQRVWDLAKDVSGDILAGNPHADSHGNKSTWHFYKGDMEAVKRNDSSFVSVPAGSLLARWQTENDPTKRRELAERIQKLALGDAAGRGRVSGRNSIPSTPGPRAVSAEPRLVAGWSRSRQTIWQTSTWARHDAHRSRGTCPAHHRVPRSGQACRGANSGRGSAA